MADIAIGEIGVPVAAWVLPSLALAASSLALGTWLRIEATVGSLVLAWVVVVSSVRWFDGADVAFADSTTFATPGRVLAVATLVVAVAVIAVRRDEFQTMEVFA